MTGESESRCDVTILSAEIIGEEQIIRLKFNDEEPTEFRYVVAPSYGPGTEVYRWYNRLMRRNPEANMVLRRTFRMLSEGERCDFPIFVPDPCPIRAVREIRG